ncbi:MAG: hypothetical protein RIA10_00660 [Amphiplicatus sp.]
MKSSKRAPCWAGRAVAFVFAACLLVSPAGAAQKPNCEDVTLPVSVLAGGPKSYSLYGELCHPDGGPSSVIQILVHGYTYDHRYWSNPAFGAAYDYVAAANEAGYTTFAIDRLGSAGLSSRPLSALVTMLADAVSLHDVVSAARSGAVPGGPYETVLSVGHSLGTAAAWLEASLYHDVDGLISSGLGHPIGNIHGLVLQSLPALLDWRLRPLVGLDAGYLTTTPGARANLFYRAATADPAVIAHDEATKGLGTAAEIATLLLYEAATLSIDVPVLLVLGEYDGFFCLQAGNGGLDNCASNATLDASERVFFPLSPDFEAWVQQEAGHNNNLHFNAEGWFAKANDWALARFPPQ